MGLSVLLTDQIELVNTSIKAGSVVIAGFFLGILIWITVFPFMIDYAESKIDGVQLVIRYISGLLLVGFSILFLYLGITGFLG